MNRTLGCVMACLVLCLPLSLRAQESGGSAAEVEATHQALRTIKNDMEQALNAQDLDKLLLHVHPNVVFTTMNNDVRVGKDAIRAYYDKMMNGPDRVVQKLTAKFEVDELTRLYGSTGVAQGSSTDRYVLTDGSDITVHGRWTCTLVKEGDRWLIAAFHYSTNVFDNPVLDKVKGAAMTFGGIAAVAMLVIGIVVGRLTARRKATS
ncbi:nuclear transport factor 2 family protein [Archangium lansingense]|uniref:Nuclear transport factor 2 family protein n=1 Tax=Archangium lansingense TaxID=2995310 RepID=A0ABT3ZZW5_9BACT|nr:nuclear transport factor 2 family protein [Archangium lansinium]MCY1074941.1 nuclear transport factor 2 family protein [Archangium lansinium]